MQPFYFYFYVVFEEVDKKPSKLFFSPVKEKKSAKFSIVYKSGISLNYYFIRYTSAN